MWKGVFGEYLRGAAMQKVQKGLPECKEMDVTVWYVYTDFSS